MVYCNCFSFVVLAMSQSEDFNTVLGTRQNTVQNTGFGYQTRFDVNWFWLSDKTLPTVLNTRQNGCLLTGPGQETGASCSKVI